ncbi:PAS domain S-box protein [Hydrogenispora ethanolica]|nr:PAS domain S-box protein [Hydrogenispora ethanolica]
MKQSLMQRIQRNQLLLIITFGWLTLLALFILVWNQTVGLNQQRLLTLAKVLDRTIQRHPSLFLNSAVPAGRVRAVLESEVDPIIRSFRPGYAVGFYPSGRQRPVILIDNGGIAVHKVEEWPADAVRRPRTDSKPEYVLSWSGPHRTWLYQCAEPVLRNRRIEGYALAAVSLTSMMAFGVQLALCVSLITLGAGLVSVMASQRLNAAIRLNLQQLLLMDHPAPKPEFQIEEFDRIARFNQKVFQDLKNAEQQRVAILESISDAFFALNHQWQFTYLNRQMERISGWKRERLLGASIFQFFPRAKLEPYIPAVEGACHQGKPHQLELEWEHGVWYELHIYPAPTGISVYFQDISARKNAEIQLRESQQRLAQLLESIHHAFFTLDSKQRFTYLNQAAERLFQIRGAEWLGKVGWDFFHAYMEPGFSRELARVWREQTVSRFETFSQRLGVWIEVHAYPSAESLFIYVLDSTARKRSEETRLRLAAIVESSEDAILSTDLDGTVTSWNKGAEAMYGYPAEQAVGQPVGRLLKAPEGESSITAIFHRWKEAGMKGTTEAVMLHQNGAPVHVAIKLAALSGMNGQTIGYSGIHRDISKEVIFKKELLAERERLSVTLRSIGEGVIATDRLGRIVSMNREAESLTGYSQYEVLGQPLETVFTVIDQLTRGKYEGIVNAVLNSEEIIHLHNLFLLHQHEREIPVSVSLAPIKSGRGECFGVVLVFQDITEKQRIEQELLKAEKIESLAILAGGIAHDFNNFLSAILANLQLALAKLKRGDDISRYLEESADATRKASDLTKQLQTFSRGEAPVKKAAAIGDLIRDTVRFVLRGSKVKVEFELPEDLWPVEIDSGQISQVLHNLTLNAKQAMPGGGTLRILGRNIRIRPGSRYLPGGYVELAVQDEGDGIPPENLGRIFDPFFTTKEEGTGLGLATSYSIIKKHNGYLEVESVPLVGTTFTILLPATNARPAVEEESPEVAATREAALLLMDDEATIRDSVGEMLRDAGYRVVLARDGREVLEDYRRAMEEGAPFDLVIMDLTVPGGLGGQETIAELKTVDPAVRAIVSSGYANDPIIAEYQKYGFCGVAAKPYKFAELKRIIDRALVGS